MLISLVVALSISGVANASDPGLVLLNDFSIGASRGYQNQLRAVATARMNVQSADLPAQVKPSSWTSYMDNTTRPWGGGRDTSRFLDRVIPLITGQYADRVIYQWLNLPEPVWVPVSQMKMPLGVRGGVGQHFAVSKKATHLVSDIGTSGHHNGIPDRGEWVELSIGLVPTGSRAVYSTSVVVSSDEPCVWVEPLGSQEMAEWGYGRDPLGVSASLYVSTDCKPGQEVTLQVRVADTKNGEYIDKLSPRFRVGKGSGVTQIQVTLDADVKGYSGGRPFPAEAGGRYEISAMVKASGKHTLIHHRAPKDQRLFSDLKDIRGLRTKSFSPRWFQPEDDVDFRLSSLDELRRWCKEQRRPWAVPDLVNVPFAVDIYSYDESEITADTPTDAEVLERAVKAYSALVIRAPDLSAVAPSFAGLTDVRAFEEMAHDAFAHPKMEWASGFIALMRNMATAHSAATPRRGGYWNRHVHLVPMSIPKYHAPPPPPPRVVVAPPPPVVKEQTVFVTTGAGLSIDRIGQAFSIAPIAHATAGGRVKVVSEYTTGSHTSVSEYGALPSAAYSALSVATRYSFVYTDAFQMGIEGGVGSRTVTKPVATSFLETREESTSHQYYLAGLTADLLLGQLGFWGHIGGTTKSPWGTVIEATAFGTPRSEILSIGGTRLALGVHYTF